MHHSPASKCCSSNWRRGEGCFRRALGTHCSWALRFRTSLSFLRLKVQPDQGLRCLLNAKTQSRAIISLAVRVLATVYVLCRTVARGNKPRGGFPMDEGESHQPGKDARITPRRRVSKAEASQTCPWDVVVVLVGSLGYQ